MKTKKAQIIFMALIVSLTMLSQKSYSQKAEKATKYETIDLEVSMSCNACSNKLGKCLAYEKGVKDFDIDLKNKNVRVKYNKSKTSKKEIIKSISNLDFEVTEKDAKCKTETKCNKKTTKCCNKKS
ncbi:MAG: heavy metal-associated domain-containing protein [Bacteroidota bacterium]|nr:heavy metal-associated domain-containing protein [Bacteroidota bacterium]